MDIDRDGYTFVIEPSVLREDGVFLRLVDRNIGLGVGSHISPDLARKLAMALLDVAKGTEQ
jgi:hypothetical protein